MPDDNKPQDVAEGPTKQFFDKIGGITVWKNPTTNPPLYWIDGSTKTYTDPNLARAAARAKAEEAEKPRQDNKSVEDYLPTPEEPDEDTPGDHGGGQDLNPGQGPDDEPPAAPAILKPRGRGPRL